MLLWQAIAIAAMVLLVVALSLQGRQYHGPEPAIVANVSVDDIMPRWNRDTEILFFSHIPRTGGGTFSSIVGATLGREKCHPQSHEGKSILHWKKFLTEGNDGGNSWCQQYRGIYAHEDFSLLEYIPCPARALVFIRDPIAERRSLWDPTYRAIRMFDVYLLSRRAYPSYEEYVGSDLYPTMYQLEWVAGVTTLWPRSKASGRVVKRLHEDTDLMMERAKRNLLGTSWFGITERYNESLCMFFGTHELVPPPYGAWAVLHPSKGSRPAPSQEILDRQRELLSLEYEFYEWAASLFAMRWDLFVKRYRANPPFYEPYLAPECEGFLPIQR